MATLQQAIRAVAQERAEQAHSNLMGGSMNPWYEVMSAYDASKVLSIVYGIVTEQIEPELERQTEICYNNIFGRE